MACFGCGTDAKRRIVDQMVPGGGYEPGNCLPLVGVVVLCKVGVGVGRFLIHCLHCRVPCLLGVWLLLNHPVLWVSGSCP